MKVDVYLESATGKDGFVRAMDARAKLVFGLLLIALSIASGNPLVPVSAGAACLFVLAISGVPVRPIALRLAEPMFFAALLAVFQAFIAPGRPVFGFFVMGHPFSLSAEGLARGSMVLARVFGAVSVVLFVTMTTPIHGLLSAAARLRVPAALVEISLFAYRYVFVLLEDAVSVYQAQKGRLGYSGFARGISSLGLLCGSVFLRACRQAQATGAAMVQRGYSGEYVPEHSGRLSLADAAFLGGLLAICMAVQIWTL